MPSSSGYAIVPNSLPEAIALFAATNIVTIMNTAAGLKNKPKRINNPPKNSAQEASKPQSVNEKFIPIKLTADPIFVQSSGPANIFFPP